jgi:hypothetical protein|nr:hypothetical protein [Phenylobacterium sp.]
MNFRSLFAAASVAAVVLAAQPAAAAVYTSFTSLLSGGVLRDFEGQAEGTLISNQLGGVTFSQTPSGLPQIDNIPQLFGYGPSSGVGVLTGSTQGGNAFPTIAGINAAFTTGHNAVEFFFSDTVPVGGAYPITFYGSGGSVLGSLSLAAASILPPGYAGGIFPPAGTSPLPGLFIGFTSAGNDIFGFSVGPGASTNDSFAIDDVRWTTGVIPEPSIWALMLLGFGGLGAVLRRARRVAARA